MNPRLPLSTERPFDARSRICYVAAIFLIGTISTLTTPALIEGWSARFGWSEIALGALASAELGGMAPSSLCALYWQKRWNWRHVGAAALLLLIVANIGCVGAEGFAELFALRFACGLAEGSICGFFLGFVANIARPERIVSFCTFCQIVGQAIAFWTVGMLIANGLSTLYIGVAIGSAALLPFLPLLPRGWPSDSEQSQKRSAPTIVRRDRFRGLIILLGFAAFGLFQSGVFSFLGQFGHLGAGLDDHDTVTSIGLSVVGSALGPTASFLLGDRIGLRLPIVAAVLLQVIILGLLTFTRYPAWVYVVEIGILQIGWTFLVTYLYTAIIEVDPELTVASMPVQVLSGAAGATIFGMALDRWELGGAFMAGSMALTLIVLLTVPLIRPRQPALRSSPR